MPSKPRASTPDETRRYGLMLSALTEQAKEKSKRSIEDANRATFTAANPPPGVVPEPARGMAMDSAGYPPGLGGWAAQQSLLATEGLAFLGYPYLSQLAQRTEYRRGVEVIAGEAVRKWIEFEATGDDDKSEKIAEIEAALTELSARDTIAKMIADDAYFGRGHLYLDIGDDDDSDELTKPIGYGKSQISKSKVNKKKPLRRIKTIEPTWVYPMSYNANNPLAEDWYSPSIWYVMGKPIHCTRILTMIGRPVPDLLKPAYSFGGVSLTQLMKPSVDIWLRIRDSVGDLVVAFSVFVLSTDMKVMLQQGGAEAILNRIAMFQEYRDNRGVMLLDRDREAFGNVSTSIGGLEQIQAQAQEHVATSASIPLVKYIGDQPAGLNASSEGALRTFYDSIAAFQNTTVKPVLQRLVDFVQLSLYGEVDKDISFKFKPLWELDEVQLAQVEQVKATTDQIRIDSGVISPEEARANVACP